MPLEAGPPGQAQRGHVAENEFLAVAQLQAQHLLGIAVEDLTAPVDAERATAHQAIAVGGLKLLASWSNRPTLGRWFLEALRNG